MSGLYIRKIILLVNSIVILRVFRFIYFLFNVLCCQMIVSVMVRVNESKSLFAW